MTPGEDAEVPAGPGRTGPGDQTRDAAPGGEAPGRGVIRASWTGTGVLGAASLAGVVDPDRLGGLAAGVSLVLFAVGCVAFLVAYARAVVRSQAEEISVAGLFGLSGSAPKAVQRSLLLSVGAQTAIVVTAASIRPFTALAFGILAPVYGVGVAGLWGAAHGTFPPRHRPHRTGNG